MAAITLSHGKQLPAEQFEDEIIGEIPVGWEKTKQHCRLPQDTKKTPGSQTASRH
jgi:hypothetical protein